MSSSESHTTFHLVSHKRRALQVAEQILEAIRRGDLTTGDKLPSERELAESTGVSRPSVREALTALQIIGTLDARPGDGTYISATASQATLDMLPEIRSTPGLAESLEVRRVIELGLAHVVVERVTETAVHDLEDCLSVLRAAASELDFESYNSANAHFHQLYLESTGSPSLIASFSSLTGTMLSQLATTMRRERYRDPAFFKKNFRVHATVLKAIRERNLVALLKAVDLHYRQIEHTL